MTNDIASNIGSKLHPEKEDNNSHAPAISLPKGGGAIRGIGEKFSVNPVMGTGSLTVPIFSSRGRSNFFPELALSYDSGAGNGPFGLGWRLSIPSITRKTDKGLPVYDDASVSDVFILSDAEDLVPALSQLGDQWQPMPVPDVTLNAQTYDIRPYRPRIEGLFGRIERWQRKSDGEYTGAQLRKTMLPAFTARSQTAGSLIPEISPGFSNGCWKQHSMTKATSFFTNTRPKILPELI